MTQELKDERAEFYAFCDYYIDVADDVDRDWLLRTARRWDEWRLRRAAQPPAEEGANIGLPGTTAFAMRGLYKPVIEYFIDGKSCTPDEYIAWQAGIIEAVTKAKLPDPKYYGGSAEEGDEHEVKCAYVDGWNNCRASIIASPASSTSEQQSAYEALERHRMAGGYVPTLPALNANQCALPVASSASERTAEDAGGDEVGKIVMFGDALKEVSWRGGKMPANGTKLYRRPAPANQAVGLSVEQRDAIDNACRLLWNYRRVEAKKTIDVMRALLTATQPSATDEPHIAPLLRDAPSATLTDEQRCAQLHDELKAYLSKRDQGRVIGAVRRIILLSRATAEEKGGKMNECQECGMVVADGEYHPYAACLMFKACHDGDMVRASLQAVLDDERCTSPDKEAVIEQCAQLVDRIAKSKQDRYSDTALVRSISARIRALKAAPTSALERMAENAHELGLDYEPMPASTDAEGEKT